MSLGLCARTMCVHVFELLIVDIPLIGYETKYLHFFEIQRKNKFKKNTDRKR